MFRDKALEVDHFDVKISLWSHFWEVGEETMVGGAVIPPLYETLFMLALLMFLLELQIQ